MLPRGHALANKGTIPGRSRMVRAPVYHVDGGLYGSGARKIQGFLERLRSSLRNNPPRPSSPSPMQSKSPPCQLQPDQNQPDLWERFPGCTKAIFCRHILPPVAADWYIMTCTTYHTYFAAIGDMPSRRCDDRSLGSIKKIARSNHSGQTFTQRPQNSGPTLDNP